MRFFLPILLAVVPLATTAQTKPVLPAAFSVQDSLPGTAARQAYLSYKTAKQGVLDSASVHNGHFQFKGTIAGSARAELILRTAGTPVAESPERLTFYLEKGPIAITRTTHLPQATAIGTPLNDENTALAKQLQPIQAQIESLSSAFAALPAAEQDSPAVAAGFNQQVHPLYQQRQQMYAAYLKAHPSHPYSLYVLESYAGPRPELDSYATLFTALAPSVRMSPHGQLIQQRITQLQQVAIGALAPTSARQPPVESRSSSLTCGDSTCSSISGPPGAFPAGSKPPSWSRFTTGINARASRFWACRWTGKSSGLPGSKPLPMMV